MDLIWSAMTSHVPAAQTSPTVQSSLSLHEAVLLVFPQPLAESQGSSMQMFPSSQSDGTPPTHAPAEHVSAVVQASLSSHKAELFVETQPVCESQESSVHGLTSSQSSGVVPGWHAPAEQVSPVVQASPSSHGAVLLTLTQSAFGLQESSVQTFPSRHSLVGSGAFTQPLAESQESSVQTFPSSQLGGAPPTHAPAEQVSPVVQASPSSHEAVLLVNTQPVFPASSQESSVQGLASSQMVRPAGSCRSRPARYHRRRLRSHRSRDRCRCRHRHRPSRCRPSI